MFEPDLLSGRVPIRPRRTIEKLSDTVIERLGEATPQKAGLMSAKDKNFLDGSYLEPTSLTKVRTISKKWENISGSSGSNSNQYFANTAHFHIFLFPENVEIVDFEGDQNNEWISVNLSYPIGINRSTHCYYRFQNQSNFNFILILDLYAVGIKMVEIPAHSFMEVRMFKVSAKTLFNITRPVANITEDETFNY